MPLSPPNSRRGFTTVEMLVVIAILLLLATISLVQFSQRDAGLSRVAAEARKIQTLFSTARTYALSENGYFQAVVSLDNTSYWIDETDASGNVIRPKVVPPETMDEQVHIPDMLVDSIVVSSGRANVRFFPQGNSSDASIYMVKRGADTAVSENFYTVKLAAPTGKADIIQNKRD